MLHPWTKWRWVETAIILLSRAEYSAERTESEADASGVETMSTAPRITTSASTRERPIRLSSSTLTW
jgi:hypothetical protein